MYDIAIIGLGPAGSVLARMLACQAKLRQAGSNSVTRNVAQKLRVVAIDKKRRNEGGFQKPCGGLLAPDGQKALACLGLTLPKDVLVDPQIFSVHTMDFDTGASTYYQRLYINLDRHRFDLWLQDQIPRTVEVYTDAYCTKVVRINGGFEITYKAGLKTSVLQARVVVGADGAASMVRRALFPKKKPTQYMSIQQWFQNDRLTPFYSCIFDSKNTDCYSWALSKDQSLIFGGAYPMDHSRERFERQKKQLERFGIALGEPFKTEACLVLRPKSPKDFCCGEQGAFFIGEAAGFISPSSLEGISSAIGSAVLLGNILLQGSSRMNERYDAATRKMRAKILMKRLKCPFMYQPFLRKLVMKSGLTAISVQDGDLSQHGGI